MEEGTAPCRTINSYSMSRSTNFFCRQTRQALRLRSKVYIQRSRSKSFNIGTFWARLPSSQRALAENPHSIAHSIYLRETGLVVSIGTSRCETSAHVMIGTGPPQQRPNERQRRPLPFSRVDDARLGALVGECGADDWKLLVFHLSNGSIQRTPRQCRERWTHYLSGTAFLRACNVVRAAALLTDGRGPRATVGA
jgi:hypothetical protein